ncbi:MAG: hypothetical protein K5880_16200 [Hydrogenophaga sp.]|uniref:hypothetical protein n=1 Tax=Hydrogenophaga sp. TaxID=1904254 RepID=UPI002631D280|nr:hypothetical protein [Hydrogenophaga sp.]MCV0440142.1 hypothetical protein [Hydrogenophaga sp.]
MNDALHGPSSTGPATAHPAIEFIGVDKRFPARGKTATPWASRPRSRSRHCS